jgi:tryptophan-rich sensory protein
VNVAVIVIWVFVVVVIGISEVVVFEEVVEAGSQLQLASWFKSRFVRQYNPVFP